MHGNAFKLADVVFESERLNSGFVISLKKKKAECASAFFII